MSQQKSRVLQRRGFSFWCVDCCCIFLLMLLKEPAQLSFAVPLLNHNETGHREIFEAKLSQRYGKSSQFLVTVFLWVFG